MNPTFLWSIFLIVAFPFLNLGASSHNGISILPCGQKGEIALQQQHVRPCAKHTKGGI